MNLVSAVASLRSTTSKSARGTVVEWIHSLKFQYIGEGTYVKAKAWKIGRTLAGLVWLGLGCAILSIPALNLGIFWLRMVAVVIAFAEAYGYLFTRHSLIGLASFYQYKPTIGVGRRRIVAIVSAQILGFMGLAVLIAGQTFGWWQGQFDSHAT